MTSPYIPHLIILAGLIGIHSQIITVSKVPGKTGGSISIPCLYEHRYRDHVKYLCEGSHFFRCDIVVQTDQPQSRRFSIYDDRNHNTFNVSITDLKAEDTHYWCAVELEHKRDVKKYFQLSVTTGMSSLSVPQQEVAASEGGSVTVMCHYKYPGATKWCRLGRDCVTSTSRIIDGTPVTINTSVPNVFTVTMSELRPESSGWYWCAVGEFQMPVHITVHGSTSTTTTTMSPNTPNFTGTHATIATASREKSSTTVTILITTLVLLLLLAVPAACFGWRMIRRNQTRPGGPDITAGSQTGSGPEVFYANVVHNRHVAAQSEQDHMPEESVTYSTVVIKDKAQRRAEPAAESVIYSTLH